MSTEQNKAIMQRVYDEVINAGDLDAADEFIAADVVEHEEFPGLAPGIEGFKQFFTMFRQAFPDVEFHVDDMIAEGDKVVARLTITGTHRGEFAGIAATGKRIKVSVIDIMRFEGGKGAEHWGVTDQLTMMQQLGVVPATA